MADDDKTDVLTLARKRYDNCVELRVHWERLALQDLKFKAGTDGEKSYQWDQTVQSQRNNENRPCFTINRIPSFIKQVVNQQRQAGPTIQVAPVGDGDEGVAEAFQGLIRHVINLSDGEIAIDTAFENAASAGVGYAVVVPRYVDEGSDDQELYLDWVPDIFSVYMDYGAVKPDRSDMRYAFRVTTLPDEEYEATWGALPASARGSLPPAQQARWFPQGGVTIADYYEIKETKGKDTRRPGKRSVIWRTINGIAVLAETELPISRIPIVPCFGDQVFLEGKEDWRGMVRDGWDAQKAFNYWYTAITEQIALGSKAPYVLDPRQIESFEELWKTANVKNHAFLPALRYVTMPDGANVDMGFPERNTAEPPIQAMTVALNYSDQALKQVMNLYEPSLGQRKSEQSGRAILALQQQGDIGNANYIDNLKRFLRSLGRLLLEMIPVYYDAPRVVRILGSDEKPQTIMVHTGSPEAPAQPPDGVKEIYDLSVGRYDVTVSTGPSFVNKKQEQLSHLIDYLKIDPRAAAVSGDIIAGALELPELQNRMKKMLPPQFQENGSPEAEQAKMQQQLQQMGQMLDHLTKELQAKTQAIETDQVKQQAQVEMKKIDAQTKIATSQLDRDAKIVVAAINAKMSNQQVLLEAAQSAAELLHTHAHESAEAELDRQHEAGLAQQQMAQQADQASQQRAHEANQQQTDLDAQAEQAQTEPVGTEA